MKFLFIIGIFLCSNLAIAASKIVDYRYGNQITGSNLTIYDDGTVKRFERRPRGQIEEVATESLNTEILNNLFQQIDDSSLFPEERTSAGQSGNGSSAGYLHVFQNEGVINIRTIEFGNLDGSPQPVIFNTSPRAREIENLVYKMVLKPMTL